MLAQGPGAREQHHSCELGGSCGKGPRADPGINLKQGDLTRCLSARRRNRRAQYHAMISGSRLRRVIIISGDGDYAHLVSNLVEDEIAAQIWGISQSINHDAYTRIIGADNIREIDSLCRYART